MSGNRRCGGVKRETERGAWDKTTEGKRGRKAERKREKKRGKVRRREE